MPGYLSRPTEDIDVVDEVPKELREQHALLSELKDRYGLELAHFQQHYLPMRWQDRLHYFDTFGELTVYLVDVYDVALSKLFSIRTKGFDDLKQFGHFEDEWLRGGPVRRWVPKALQDKPIYVFETGGTTGIPKSRVVIDDFRIDYEMFSASLPEKYFPKGSNWLMLGPSGPRRLRLAVEHLCQYRGGICFCVDLDPRWVIKLIKKGWTEHLKAYQEHVIDQAMTVLSAGHDIKCLFTTPKLLDALAKRLEEEGSSVARTGITGIFCGGTEMTSQWIRFTIQEYLGPGVYIAPTYGNTLMGLAAAEMPTAKDGYKINYYAPQPRAVAEVVDFDNNDKVVEHGKEGRVMLTT